MAEVFSNNEGFNFQAKYNNSTSHKERCGHVRFQRESTTAGKMNKIATSFYLKICQPSGYEYMDVHRHWRVNVSVHNPEIEPYMVNRF